MGRPAQGNWTPTKRRGPIAAEFSGPGPAAIGLPSLFGSKFSFNLGAKLCRLSCLSGYTRSVRIHFVYFVYIFFFCAKEIYIYIYKERERMILVYFGRPRFLFWFPVWLSGMKIQIKYAGRGVLRYRFAEYLNRWSTDLR